MKNKNFTRFLCFFMCFCLCFAWFGPSIEAEAASLSWVLWMIIVFMASSGVSFAATGVASALADGIQEMGERYVNETQDISFSDWLLAIANNSNISLDGFWTLGSVAVEAITGFMDWLSENEFWTAGSSHDVGSYSMWCRTWTVNGETIKVYQPKVTVLEPADASSFVGNLGYSVLGQVDIEGTVLPAGCTISYNQGSAIFDNFYNIVSSNGDIQVNAAEIVGEFDYSVVDIKGIGWTMVSSLGAHYFSFVYYLDDGNAVALSQIRCQYSNYLASETIKGSVSIPPSGITPPVVDPNSIVVLNTGDVSGTTNDEIASAVMDSVINDTLTVFPDLTLDDSLDSDITTDGTLEGNVSGIFSGVQALIELIKSIPSLILDGIKSIFIPDPDDMNAQFMALLEEINDKYSFDFDLDSLFSGEKEPEDITAQYTVGSLSWDVTFVSWYYLKKGVEFFRPYIRGFIVFLLVFFQLRQFMAVLNMMALDSGPSGSSAPSSSSTALTIRDSGGVVKK